MITALSRFSSSLMSLLDDSSDSDVESRIEDIRDAMLGCLDECLGESQARPALWDKITGAPCVQTLWYLRVDLMAFLAFRNGEAAAKKRLVLITEKFRGGLQVSKSPTKQVTSSGFYLMLICINAALIWKSAWP